MTDLALQEWFAEQIRYHEAQSRGHQEKAEKLREEQEADLLGGNVSREHPIDEQIWCVRRELELRKRSYPRWVSTGKMKAEEADEAINCMQAVYDTLVAVKEGEQR
jgi:hypothetical protein